jgi:hypothetical protein
MRISFFIGENRRDGKKNTTADIMAFMQDVTADRAIFSNTCKSWTVNETTGGWTNPSTGQLLIENGWALNFSNVNACNIVQLGAAIIAVTDQQEVGVQYDYKHNGLIYNTLQVRVNAGVGVHQLKRSISALTGGFTEYNLKGGGSLFNIWVDPADLHEIWGDLINAINKTGLIVGYHAEVQAVKEWGACCTMSDFFSLAQQLPRK